MTCEINDGILELIGADSPEYIVIADGEIDINHSTVIAEDIKTASFDRYTSVEKAQKETLKNRLDLAKGVYVKIEKSLESPLHIVFEHGENPGQYLFLEVADEVKATIVEHHIACCCGASFEAGKPVPVKVEASFGQASNLLYSGFDTSGLELEVERTMEVRKDTNLDVAIGMFGNSTVSQNYVALLEEGAHVETKLMMFGKGEQKQLHKLKMSHFAPYTVSNMINHGVVADRARGEFEGIGYIEKGAHQSDAQQESRIMVLDEKSHADVHPILLIDEYDVMAGHAGSVGRVSDDELYYLQSRGLSRKEAMLLVTEGFLRPVVEGIEDEQMKERIEAVIKEKVGAESGLA